jgi:hypothetical protein
MEIGWQGISKWKKIGNRCCRTLRASKRTESRRNDTFSNHQIYTFTGDNKYRSEGPIQWAIRCMKLIPVNIHLVPLIWKSAPDGSEWFLHAPAALTPGKEFTAPIEWGTVLASEIVWAFWRRENSFASARNRLTLARLFSRILVTTATTMFRIQKCALFRFKEDRYILWRWQFDPQA